MNVLTPGLQYYVDRIKSGEPFSLIRHGDGEWIVAVRHKRTALNCDQTSLTIPGLIRDLQQSLRTPYKVENYVMALRPSSVTQYAQIGTWIRANVPKWVQWHDCRVFHLASHKGHLYPLVEALRDLKIPLIFVGHPRLEKLGRHFPEMRHIAVASQDCYNDKAAILAQILAVERPAFFSFSAGPATKVFIHQLFPTIGDKSFMLDLGSLWDVYVNGWTRGYHKLMSSEVIRINMLGK